MKYRVRQNMSAFRPTRWHGTDYERQFGDRNQGFVIDAADDDNARAIVRAQPHRLNPGLLLIEVEA